MFVVVTEEFSAVEYVGAQFAVAPVVIEQFAKLLSRNAFFVVNKLFDDGNRINHAHQAVHIQVGGKPLCAALRCAFCAFDTSRHKQRRDHVDIFRARGIE